MHRFTALIAIGLLMFFVAGGECSTNGGSNVVTPVKLNMTTARSLVGQTAQFSANVPVTWAT